MATVSKEIADDIIAGKYAEDGAIKIIKYTNMSGEDAYGVVYPSDDLDKYHTSIFVNNPVLYWQDPDFKEPIPPEGSLPVTLFTLPAGDKVVKHITNVSPEDAKWFIEHKVQLSMEEVSGMIAVYADIGLTDEDGESDEIMTLSAGRSCEVTLSELRKLCEMALDKSK